uniref:Uncharacterized protein n=1 Tax=Romanomermis culicivorax TaxID=13658 RepID=A0A915KM69_ROMCU
MSPDSDALRPFGVVQKRPDGPENEQLRQTGMLQCCRASIFYVTEPWFSKETDEDNATSARNTSPHLTKLRAIFMANLGGFSHKNSTWYKRPMATVVTIFELDDKATKCKNLVILHKTSPPTKR